MKASRAHPASTSATSSRSASASSHSSSEPSDQRRCVSSAAPSLSLVPAIDEPRASPSPFARPAHVGRGVDWLSEAGRNPGFPLFRAPGSCLDAVHVAFEPPRWRVPTGCGRVWLATSYPAHVTPRVWRPKSHPSTVCARAGPPNTGPSRVRTDVWRSRSSPSPVWRPAFPPRPGERRRKRACTHHGRAHRHSRARGYALRGSSAVEGRGAALRAPPLWLKAMVHLHRLVPPWLEEACPPGRSTSFHGVDSGFRRNDGMRGRARISEASEASADSHPHHRDFGLRKKTWPEAASASSLACRLRSSLTQPPMVAQVWGAKAIPACLAPSATRRKKSWSWVQSTRPSLVASIN